ncbi:MAG: class I SAM-dependent methyltransferase [Gallionella sp.]|nr:class I SAM-dependent methyltransferase [Gallionella sp.]
MKDTELATEKLFLDKVNAAYTVNDSLQTKEMRKLIVRTFSPFLKNGRGLELGCSDGYMTSMLSRHVSFLDVVDGSELFLKEARERTITEQIDNISFINSLFEEFSPRKKYDYVIASYIMEHVLHPVDVLRMAYDALKDDGLLFVVVPNANALSRQLAMHMGMYEHLKVLTANDLKHGHRRVYDRTSLNKDIEQAGFENIAQGGLMLKILADFQMDKLIEEGILGQDQIDGLYKLGLEYPDLCGSLFSVCRKKE